MLRADFCGEFSEKLNSLKDSKIYKGYDDLDGPLYKEIKFSKMILEMLIAKIANNPDAKIFSKEDLILFKQFFADRWERIKDTNLSYTVNPHVPFNALCFEIATYIAKYANENINPFQLLMPTIELKDNDVSGTSLDEKDLTLNDFILSDDNKRFIDIFECLRLAEKDGTLRHMSLFKGEAKDLSKAEAQRIIHHSEYTKKYYKAITKRAYFKKDGEGFGQKLERLVDDLRKNGAKGSGTEDKANEKIYKVIWDFDAWMNSLPDQELTFLKSLKTEPGVLPKNFGEIWLGILKDPSKNLIDCIDTLASYIESVLKANPIIYKKPGSNLSIQTLDTVCEERKSALQTALKDPALKVQCGYPASNDQISFAITDFSSSLITSAQELCSLLSFVEENKRYAVIKSIKNVNTLFNTAKDFYRLVRLLNEDERNLFFKKHARQFISLIQREKDLMATIELFKEEGKLKIISALGSSRIFTILNNSPIQLAKFLQTLSIKERAALFQQCASEGINFISSIADFNQFILLNPSAKNMKQTLAALSKDYAAYPEAHRSLLLTLNQAYRETRIAKKTQSRFFSYNPDADEKISDSKKLDQVIKGEIMFFPLKKNNGRLAKIVKHLQVYSKSNSNSNSNS